MAQGTTCILGLHLSRASAWGVGGDQHAQRRVAAERNLPPTWSIEPGPGGRAGTRSPPLPLPDPCTSEASAATNTARQWVQAPGPSLRGLPGQHPGPAGLALL